MFEGCRFEGSRGASRLCCVVIGGDGGGAWSGRPNNVHVRYISKVTDVLYERTIQPNTDSRDSCIRPKFYRHNGYRACRCREGPAALCIENDVGRNLLSVLKSLSVAI